MVSEWHEREVDHVNGGVWKYIFNTLKFENLTFIYVVSGGCFQQNNALVEIYASLIGSLDFGRSLVKFFFSLLPVLQLVGPTLFRQLQSLLCGHLLDVGHLQYQIRVFHFVGEVVENIFSKFNNQSGILEKINKFNTSTDNLWLNL